MKVGISLMSNDPDAKDQREGARLARPEEVTPRLARGYSRERASTALGALRKKRRRCTRR
jgi:hypothetical protein